MMMQSLSNAVTALQERNSIIDELQKLPEAERDRVAFIYLGMVDNEGDSDSRFADCMDARRIHR